MAILIDEWGMGNESGGLYTSFSEMLVFGMRCNDDHKTTNVLAIQMRCLPKLFLAIMTWLYHHALLMNSRHLPVRE